MKICVAGLTASGKTTLGDDLAAKLRITHVDASYKKVTSGDSHLLRFLDEASGDYARRFDYDIIKAAEDRNCVVTTWHGPWIIKDATVRVWLETSETERVRRCAKAKGKSAAYARKYIREKDSKAIAHYRLAYGKEMDHSVFDIDINYDRMTKDEVLSIVSMLAMVRDGRRFA